MKKLMGTFLALMMVLSFGFMGTASADENEVVALKSQVSELTKKLAKLEKKLGSVEKAANAKAAPVVAPAAAPMPDNKGIDMGGFIDVQWNNNFRQPAGVTGTNSLRIFDTDDGSFTVNAAEIWFGKEAKEAGEAGFRIDVLMGEDADVVNGDGSSDTSKIDLQQAYVEYIAPLGFFEGSSILPDSVKITAGRFVTLAGLEVIESPDNWNISRSIAFGFGIPFVHTGVRTNFGLFDDYFDVYLGVNNGWDNTVDTNAEKTLEFAFGYEPFENVSLFHAFYLGEEQAANSGTRFLWTNVLTYDITEKLSIMADFDFGRQGNMITPALTGSGDGNTANWYEYALYARYQFTDKFAMAARTELFVDGSAYRTATVSGDVINSDHTWAQTFTAEYKLTDNLITRAELRLDKSNDDRIQGGSSSQTTVGAQVLYVV